MTTTTFSVRGMTCDHCVRAVRAELGALEGVLDVGVDLATGGVTLRSERPLGDDEVRAAVEEAGYEVDP